MEDDFVLVPKYQLDMLRDEVLQIMRVIGTARRLEILSQFCKDCGAVNPLHVCSRVVKVVK